MSGRTFWLTLLAAVATTVAITSAAWVFLIQPVQQAVRAGNALRKEFVERLQFTPQITANNAAIFAQNTPTLELVTVRREALIRHRFEESWLHSKKTFEVESPFTVRAGFFLREPFSVNVLRGGKIAEIRLPAAKLLSVEAGDLRILRDEDGLWNKLTAEDREKAIRTLTTTAKREFLQTDILAAAKTEAEDRIREIAQAIGCEAVFLDGGPAAHD